MSSSIYENVNIRVCVNNRLGVNIEEIHSWKGHTCYLSNKLSNYMAIIHRARLLLHQSESNNHSIKFY